jgi:nitronate monooxygenase
MSLPERLNGHLRVPAIVAPMFLISGPDLVVEACRSGLLGTFPALNRRTTEGFEEWLVEIENRLKGFRQAAPFGVNLIVHKSNPRLTADLDVVVRHKAPVVITSLGAVRDVVDAVHSYGGLVFHDVINRRHAEKAAAAGVDGIVAVCSGAGGHAGTTSPFALVGEIRSFFAGMIVVAGAISHGSHIAAVRTLGADLAYIGTRFIATKESMVSGQYKDMLVSSRAADIVYTDRISGVHANFLRPSIIAAGLDPDNLPQHGGLELQEEAKAWKTLWSAGQGVGAVSDVPTTAELCDRMVAEYREAVAATRQYLFAMDGWKLPPN